MRSLEKIAQNIRLVVLDVDGVLTDGHINISPKGELFKSFHVRDGLGIKRLQKAGIDVAIITGRTSSIVASRAHELGITRVMQGQSFKTPAYESIIGDLNLTDEQVAYMGDDVPDLPLLRRVGLPCTPSDGIDDLSQVVRWRAPHPGGAGAVRDLAELILKARGCWDDLVNSIYVEGH